MLWHMVTTLSDPTLGLLVETIDHEYSKDQILTLLLRADLRQYEALGQGGSSKQGLIRKHICGAQDLVRSHDDAQAHKALLNLVRLLVEDAVGDPQAPPGWFGNLREALLADGFELTWTREEKAPISESPWISRRPTVIVTYRILPTDSGPVPLPQEISAFEHELIVRRYDDVLIHYRQAISNFEQHNAEASNSQLRTALEALVVHLATEKANWAGPSAGQGGGGPAIQHLITHGFLPERDGGKLLQGLWQISHSNGSHPGQSDADEARTRMQLVTATGRFLLRHFK